MNNIGNHILITQETCNCNKEDSRYHYPVCDADLNVCIKCGAVEIELEKPCNVSKG